MIVNRLYIKIVISFAIIFAAYLSDLTHLHASTLTGLTVSQYRVYGVVFKGVKGIDSAELKDLLATQDEASWKFWAKKKIVTLNNIEDDIIRITRFYRKKGYYNAEVTYKILTLDLAEINKDSNKDNNEQKEAEKDKSIKNAVITFNITEGTPVLISSIKVDISEDVKAISKKKLFEILSIKENGVFDSDKYTESKTLALKYFANNGRPFADISGSVSVDIKKNTAFVKYKIKPGMEAFFGEIQIKGNDGYVDRGVIEKSLSFEKGKLYSQSMVADSRRNLLKLNVFKTVVIRPVKPAEETGGSREVLIEIVLKKKKRRNLRFGAGYGTEDGIRLVGSFVYRNTFGYADETSVSLKRSDLVENLEGNYVYPYFFHEATSLNIGAGIERDKFEYYTLKKVYSKAAIDRKLDSAWSITSGYNLELSRLEDLEIKRGYELEQLQNDNNYFISSVFAGFLRNTTDLDLEPTKGLKISALVEGASSVLSSEVDFIKPVFEANYFFPLPMDIVFASRARWRSISKTENTDTIPIFKRLFLGGGNTVRGYGYRKLWPLDETGTPIGGLASFDGNIELRFPLYKDFSGVTFVDGGVIDRKACRYNFDDMRYSAGVGLRYKTIIGPVRADFGYQLNPVKRKELGAGTAYPNEYFDDRWKFHVSIGHAF